jgi:hypothetical protein
LCGLYRWSPVWRPAIACGLVLFATSVWTTSSQGVAHPAELVSVTERDFSIKAPKVVRAGEVTLRVHNLGPDRHELIAVRVGSARLPSAPTA